jgi:hypothetical protein
MPIEARWRVASAAERWKVSQCDSLALIAISDVRVFVLFTTCVRMMGGELRYALAESIAFEFKRLA